MVLRNHPEAIKSNGNYVGSCDRSTYPSIYLYINGKYFEIDPQTYVIDYDSGVSGKCTIAITYTKSDHWILGGLIPQKLLFNLG